VCVQLDWYGDLDNPNNSKVDWKAESEPEAELENSIEEEETPEQRNVRAGLHVLELIRPTQR
jgi:hypothetical protein